MNAHELIGLIELLAPPRCAASWDRCGVQIASEREAVRTLAVTLDPTPRAIGQALAAGADFILAHHPLALDPKLPSRIDSYHKVLAQVFKSDAWLYSAHTSLDTQLDGAPAWLADALALSGRSVVDVTERQDVLALEFPADAGLPPEAATAFVAAHPGLVTLEDPRTLRLRQDRLDYVLRALTGTFGLGPERFWVTPAGESANLGYILRGNLPAPLPGPEFLALIGRILGRDRLNVIGRLPDEVRSVGYCQGSGSSVTAQAVASGLDVFLTGEVRYHLALDVAEQGCVLDVGHFVLEEQMMRVLAETLKHHLSPLGVGVAFIPGHDPVVPTGTSGRVSGMNI